MHTVCYSCPRLNNETGENKGLDEHHQDIDAETLVDLKKSLESEVQAYKEKLLLHRNKKGAVTTLTCALCPWRQFGFKHTLVEHVQRYHKEPYYTAAATTEKSKTMAQHRVIVAEFRRRALLTAVHEQHFDNNLLSLSADMIRQWNREVSQQEKAVLVLNLALA